MTTYKAPLRDMQFVMQDLLNCEQHYQSLPECKHVNIELIDAILGEASKFSEQVLAPLNTVGDEVGCQMLENGDVKTPPGFRGRIGNTSTPAGRLWTSPASTVVKTCLCRSGYPFAR